MKNYFNKLAITSMLTVLGTISTMQANEKALNTNITVVNQEQMVVGEYNGYTEAEGYKFTLKDGKTIHFKSVSEEILKTLDLKSDSLKGKSFEVTYKTSKKNGKEVKEIVKLK